MNGGIQDVLGNVGSIGAHIVEGGVSKVGNVFEAALGNVRASFSTLWSGGFVGINVNNYEVIRTAIQDMINKIEGVLSSFNANAEFETGLKGEAAEAGSEYVKAVNELLLAYATTYKNFIKLADEAVEQMRQGDTQNAAAIRSDAENLRAEAAKIRVD